MIKKLRNSFIAGIAITLPVFLTFVFIWYLFGKINLLLLEPVVDFFRPYLLSDWMVYAAKFLVLLLVLFFFCLLGMAARSILLSRAFRFIEYFLTKVPLIGRTYKAIKQISNAFIGEGKTIFRKVALIEYPRKGLYSIGFITSKGKGEVQDKVNQLAAKKVFSVFVPTTPNPTSGIFLLVPENELIELDMSVEDGLKLVISGGTVVPEYYINNK